PAERIHRSSAPAGSIVGDDQSRFSPTAQLRYPDAGYQCAIRVENDVPSNELWSKYPSSAISRECSVAAAARREFERSATRPRSVRIACSCRSKPDTSDASVVVFDEGADSAAGAETATSAATHARTVKILLPPDAMYG